MQLVSTSIWTRGAVSISYPISYEDNHYTTGTSFFVDYYYVGLLSLLLLLLFYSFESSLYQR